MYYAAQSRAAKTPQEKSSTKSMTLLYLSQWKSKEAATNFAAVYADNLKRKYTNVHIQPADASKASRESVFTTEKGPMIIATTKHKIFISENFPLPLARKLKLVMTDVLHHNGKRQVHITIPNRPQPTPKLSENLIHLLNRYDMMQTTLRR